MEVKDIVPSKDVRMVTLQRKIESAKSPEERERFEKEKFELLQGREQVIKSMREIVSKCTNSNEEVEKIMHGKSHAYTTREYKEVAEYYKYQSAMEHLYLFSNLLEEKVTVERIKTAIDEVGAAMRAEKKKEMDQPKEIEQEKM
ncbi:legumain precursor [Silurus meridionalis]|nr:legumain precursor [Silurus meridionalis]